MPKGELYGVSVGPGDPELLTLKAVRIIQEADVVAVPNSGHGRQTAYTVARQYVQNKELLECSTPMTKDRTVVEAAYAQIANDICALLDRGKRVAYLCLGDIGIYSTYVHVYGIVANRGYRASIVPGVPSFCACAAELGVALCAGQEHMLVVPVTSSNIDGVLDAAGTKVLMKPFAEVTFDELQDKLREHDLLSNASLVCDCGLPTQKVYPTLANAPKDPTYFSLVIVR